MGISVFLTPYLADICSHRSPHQEAAKQVKEAEGIKESHERRFVLSVFKIHGVLSTCINGLNLKHINLVPNLFAIPKVRIEDLWTCEIP